MFQSPIHRTTRASSDIRAGRRDWFRIQARDDSTADIDIFDEIGFFGVNARDFAAELRGVRAEVLNVHLNSPGGDVFDGIAIYNTLKEHGAAINVFVDGIAASIASIIAMAGEHVEMRKGSMMMIHEPFALTIGTASDMRKMADALDVMGGSLAGIYAERAGGTVADWQAVMAEETWYDAEEAVKAGLADKVSRDRAVKNAFDLSVFNHAPSVAPVEREDIHEEANESQSEARRREAQLAVAAAEMEVAAWQR